MARSKTKDIPVEEAPVITSNAVKKRTRKTTSVDAAAKEEAPVVAKKSKSSINQAVDKVVDNVDNLSVDMESVESKPAPKLTLLNENVDVRYGMLLHYFPKGGVLHLPMGTYETGYYVAANKHITKIVFPKTMEIVGHGSFFHCEDLTSLILGDNISMISALAFAECKNLYEVVLNSGLKEIGRKAFMGCKALSAVTIPKSVTYIGPEAFKDCVNLTLVRLPGKTQLAPTAFDNCHIDFKIEYY